MTDFTTTSCVGITSGSILTSGTTAITSYGMQGLTVGQAANHFANLQLNQDFYRDKQAAAARDRAHSKTLLLLLC